jgi:hypothetical protein
VRATHFFIVLFLLSSLSHAEDIQLKDGSKITGTITAIDGNTFHVKTAYGEIQVPRAEIVAIQFPENGSKKEGSGDGASAHVDESLDGTLYSNRTAHFQVTVPIGWIVSPDLRKAKDIVAALMSADQAHFFMVTPETYAGSLTTHRVLAESQFQNKFQDYQKLSETEIKLDGRTGIRMIFKGKTADTNTHLEFLVFILPYDGRMVRLSFFTLEPLFDDAVPVFEKMAASYHSASDKPVAKLASPHPAHLDDLLSLSFK